MSKEKINHPEYYGGKGNAYEAINVIEAWRLTFCLGNVVKYISRAGKKDDIIQDLKKAQWYLEREIQNLEKNKFHSGGFVSSEHQTQNGESIISKKDLANKSSEIRNVLDAINENKIECDRLKTQSENKIKMKVEKFIAFQTVDREGDIWCNRAFLFKSEKDALAFFSNPKLVIDTLEYKVEEHEDINKCIEITLNEGGNSVNKVVINLEYCGKKVILEMHEGFVITN